MNQSLTHIISTEIINSVQIPLDVYLVSVKQSMLSRLIPAIEDDSCISIFYAITTPVWIKPHIIAMEELEDITIPQYLGYLESIPTLIPHDDIKEYSGFPTPEILTSLTPDQNIKITITVYN